MMTPNFWPLWPVACKMQNVEWMWNGCKSCNQPTIVPGWRMIDTTSCRLSIVSDQLYACKLHYYAGTFVLIHQKQGEISNPASITVMSTKPPVDLLHVSRTCHIQGMQSYLQSRLTVQQLLCFTHIARAWPHQAGRVGGSHTSIAAINQIMLIFCGYMLTYA